MACNAKKGIPGMKLSTWEEQNGPRPLGIASKMSQESDREKARLALDRKRKDMYKPKQDAKGKK